MLYASDIIGHARRLLLDVDAVRYGDDLMVEALNAAMAGLFSLRPDCVVNEQDAAIVLDPPVPATEPDDPISIADKWRNCLVHGVLAEVYMLDSDEHEANPGGKAAKHRERFIREAQTL